MSAMKRSAFELGVAYGERRLGFNMQENDELVTLAGHLLLMTCEQIACQWRINLYREALVALGQN